MSAKREDLEASFSPSMNWRRYENFCLSYILWCVVWHTPIKPSNTKLMSHTLLTINQLTPTQAQSLCIHHHALDSAFTLSHFYYIIMHSTHNPHAITNVPFLHWTKSSYHDAHTHNHYIVHSTQPSFHHTLTEIENSRHLVMRVSVLPLPRDS